MHCFWYVWFVFDFPAFLLWPWTNWGLVRDLNTWSFCLDSILFFFSFEHSPCVLSLFSSLIYHLFASFAPPFKSHLLRTSPRLYFPLPPVLPCPSVFLSPFYSNREPLEVFLRRVVSPSLQSPSFFGSRWGIMTWITLSTVPSRLLQSPSTFIPSSCSHSKCSLYRLRPVLHSALKIYYHISAEWCNALEDICPSRTLCRSPHDVTALCLGAG